MYLENPVVDVLLQSVLKGFLDFAVLALSVDNYVALLVLPDVHQQDQLLQVAEVKLHGQRHLAVELACFVDESENFQIRALEALAELPEVG